MKTLLLVRHGKAEDPGSSASDVVRPLSSAAAKEISYASKLFLKKEIIPDVMIASPALRTLQTANELALKIGFEPKQIKKDVRIYEAEVSDLLEIINTTDDNYNIMVMVGHNPGISELVEYLCGNMMGSLPTGGVAGLTIPFDSWKLVGSGTCELALLDYIKK